MTTSTTKSLSRRDWFKCTVALSAGLTLSTSLIEQLMAAPKSVAEQNFFANTQSVKVRLNANENPYGLSPKAKEAAAQVLSQGNRYVFGEIRDLKKIFADREGVTPEHIHLAAGSSETLVQSGIAFGLEGGRILSGFPTFDLLMSFAEQTFKATWDKVDLNDKLEFDYDKIASAIKPDTKLIFVCNPNNPSSTFVDPQKVKSFCEEVSKTVPVYVDEAYLDFVEPSQQISMVDLVKKDANVIVSRTFSKVYGMAGLRMGYIVAKPELIKKIAKYGGGYGGLGLSQVSIAASKAAMHDTDFVSMVRNKNATARKVLTDYLDQQKVFYGKPVGNFVFWQASKDGKTILKKMDEAGYLMRIWDYQQKEWCRVSIGTEDEMKGFVKAFSIIS